MPCWKKGKCLEYVSRNSDAAKLQQEEEQFKLPGLQMVIPSPRKKRKEQPFKDDLSPNAANSKGCRICEKTNNCSFWLGCGHKDQVTKKETCSYWGCINGPWVFTIKMLKSLKGCFI